MKICMEEGNNSTFNSFFFPKENENIITVEDKQILRVYVKLLTWGNLK